MPSWNWAAPSSSHQHEFLHPPQGNADVLPDNQVFVGGPSTSVELLVGACGDGSSPNFKSCKSKTCQLAKTFFKPSNSVVSTVTHRMYPCINHEDNHLVTCNASNLIYLITCKKCFLQYVGETAQQLNVRFAKHRDCLKGKINSSQCKRLSDHFSTGLCKGAGYTVQIVEKFTGNGRTSRGAIDPGISVVRRKRETEWMLKLRTVYPYGLNDRVDIYSENNSTHKAKSKFGEDLVGKLFPSIPRLFDRNSESRHYNRRGLNNINYSLFVKQLEFWIKNDLPNTSITYE